MKKKQKTLLAIAVGVLLIVLAIWLNSAFSDDPAEPVTSDSTKEVVVVIYAEGDEVANESFEVSDETALMAIMEENFDMSVTDEGFVEAIEGYEQSPEDSMFWIFEVNDGMVEESAEDFVPEDGDIVVWDLAEY